jgi:hypothetical protein
MRMRMEMKMKKREKERRMEMSGEEGVWIWQYHNYLEAGGRNVDGLHECGWGKCGDERQV